MFFPVRFRTHIQLPPSELHGNFDDAIQARLQASLEGVCSRYGYVRPGSLEVLNRSAGVFVKQHFNGHIRFDILCKGDVCNPPQGMVIEATVKNINALGLLAESTMDVNGQTIPVLDIIVPKRAAGISSEIDLDSVNIGDKVLVAVMGKRYQLNDTKISIIGRAVKQASTGRPATEVNDDDVDGDEEFVEGDDVVSDVEDDDEDEEAATASGDEDEEGVIVKKAKVIDEDAEEEPGELEDYDEDADDDVAEDDDEFFGDDD